MGLHSERVNDIYRRYAVAYTAIHAAEYREIHDLPAPDEWGGDLTHAEWLDGFNTIDYKEPLGPETFVSWVLGPTEANPHDRHISEYRTGATHRNPVRAHPPIWPEFIDHPRTDSTPQSVEDWKNWEMH
jgi:hypothetical protein